MTAYDDPEALAAGVKAGDVRAIARAVTLVEEHDPRARELFVAIGGSPSEAHTVGLTGPAGAGKSTLVAALVRAARAAGRSVGVVAVDPSSARSGGALLGDRVRLAEHFTDPGVFIRSLAARGAPGGLAEGVIGTTLVLAAAGKDVVFVETVGAGQADVEIASLVDTVVLVLMPDSGDAVQALKAGLLEVPDLLVVNKSDLAGSQAAVRELRSSLALGAQPAPLITQTSARSGEGTAELWDLIEARRAALAADGLLAGRRRAVAVARALTVARAGARRLLENALEADPELEALLEEVRQGRRDPLNAADEILERFLRR